MFAIQIIAFIYYKQRGIFHIKNNLPWAPSLK